MDDPFKFPTIVVSTGIPVSRTTIAAALAQLANIFEGMATPLPDAKTDVLAEFQMLASAGAVLLRGTAIGLHPHNVPASLKCAVGRVFFVGAVCAVFPPSAIAAIQQAVKSRGAVIPAAAAMDGWLSAHGFELMPAVFDSTFRTTSEELLQALETMDLTGITAAGARLQAGTPLMRRAWSRELRSLADQFERSSIAKGRKRGGDAK